VSDFRVKELMVPLSEYATVPKGATLLNAVQALEKAQEEFDHTKYRHRAVLILDKGGQIIGKLSQMDVLRALQPKDSEAEKFSKLGKFGFSPKFVQKMHKQMLMKAVPLKVLCGNASKLKVEDFMQAPSEDEFIEHEETLEVAIMQLVTGHRLSLLVTHDSKIVGILRLTDAFAAVFHTMKESGI
jgi:CBS domain-containing protein